MFADHRNLEKPILKDLRKKFVFLAGPRQVGKTTLAQKIMKQMGGAYLLYDDEEDRLKILRHDYVSQEWVCLDEFHKFPRWKSHIKGVYDKHHDRLHLLLTGSARLDVYQKSGDSLFGRYYLHHLHPLTAGELAAPSLPALLKVLPSGLFEAHDPLPSIPGLLRFGGFPEPFFGQSEQEHRRWSNSRRQLLIREELRDISRVDMLGLLEQLMILLPKRIGSLFSFRSLAEDIRVSPPTIQNWMDLFERLFFVYKLTPYAGRVARSLKKQPKYYFYDWSQVEDEGSRFENFIASHLWKAVQTWTDLGEANLSLHFARDRDGRETDFVIARDGRPWFLVEAKLAETKVDDGLRYYCGRLQAPGVQVVLKPDVFRRDGAVTVISADRWLGRFP